MKKERPPVPPGTLALSPSKVKDLECPFRFREVHLRGVKEIPTPELLVGSLVHRVAAAYMDWLSENDESHDIGELEETIKRMWVNRDPRLGPDEWPEYRRMALNLQFRIMEGATIAGTETSIAFDKEWDSCPWESENARYGGIIDMHQVEGTGKDAMIVVTDWFCGGLGAEFESHKMMQLRFYAYLLFKKYGISKIRIVVDSLRMNSSRTVDLDHDDLVSVGEFIEAESEALAQRDPLFDDNWPAQPCAICERCQLECPLLDTVECNLFRAPKFNEETPLRTALDNAILAERYLKQAKKLLKNHVALHGPVVGEGMVAEARVSSNYWWSFRDARSMLRTL
jgi:hypothetical protein